MSSAAWVSLGATVIVGGIFFLLVLETKLLGEHEAPITTFVRSTLIHWPGRTYAAFGVVIFVVGMLFAHFVWDAGQL